MKTITKTYEVYNFNELDKEVQESVLNFKLNSECCNWTMSNKGFPKFEELKILMIYCKKQVKKLSYFKNGNLAIIS